MAQSADDAGPARRRRVSAAAFVAYIEWGSRLAAENSQAQSRIRRRTCPCRVGGGCATPTPWIARFGRWRRRRKRPVAAGRPARPPASCSTSRRTSSRLFRAMDRNSMIFAFDLWKEGGSARPRRGDPRKAEGGDHALRPALGRRRRVEVFARLAPDGGPLPNCRARCGPCGYLIRYSATACSMVTNVAPPARSCSIRPSSHRHAVAAADHVRGWNVLGD